MHQKVVEEMAKRRVRLGHFLWHGIREQWMSLEPSQQKQIEKISHGRWVPPRPSLNRAGQVRFCNGAGADFLGMHRHMIHMVNALQKKHGAAPLEGWKEPPPVGSAVKVPKGDSVPDALAKDDDHWRIIVRSAEILLHPHSLEGMSLGEFGARIEYGIHAAMHLRFGDLGTNGRLRPFIRNIFRDVSTKFDEPEYDSLLDWYSAHVHPLFWKIHGWIDDRIGDWETVNRSRIDMCAVWMGPMEHHHHHAITLAEEQALVDSMEEGVRTLIDSGISGMIRQLL